MNMWKVWYFHVAFVKTLTLIIKYCTVSMMIISTMWEHWTGMISWKCVDMAWYEFVCKLIQHSRAFRGSYITSSQGHITLHWNRLFALVACTALDCSAHTYVGTVAFVWRQGGWTCAKISNPNTRYQGLIGMLAMLNIIFVAAHPSLAL